jgi:chorismate mutase
VTDPGIDELRARIAVEDRTILDAVNRRIDLVRDLKRYKDERGIEFIDPERERYILAEVERANTGALSSEGVRALFELILALTKSELT